MERSLEIPDFEIFGEGTFHTFLQVIFWLVLQRGNNIYVIKRRKESKKNV